jgi:hypothetical protein
MEQFTLIKPKAKKAQAWSLDLIVASVIFTAGIIILYVYAINYSSQTKNQLDGLFYEGNSASQLILSENDAGILSAGKINQTKLDEFYNYDYQTKKNKLGITNDFYFTFTGLEINGVPEDYVGKINNTAIENLIQVTRITLYENKPTKFQIFIWNENE